MDEDAILKRRVSFKPEFTLGTLFQVCTMIFLAGGVWYSTKLELTALHNQIAIMTAKQDAMESKLSLIDVRQERVETKLDDDRENFFRHNRAASPKAQ